MSWLYTLTRVILAVILMAASGAEAQSLETAVMPGPVIQGHAKIEGTCDKCHTRFDRAAQSGLCLSCHKPVAADVSAGTGYHGHMKERESECRSCHAEHKGRAAKVVVLDEAKFNHAQTDFQLRGKHRKPACASCHRPKVKYSEAPSDCVSCHRKDDDDKGHKGGLGPKCGNCHGENTWKETRFDHAKTKFPLRLGHADIKIKCTDCHVGNKYVETPRECVSCHREKDMKDGHKGHFGPRCEKCHDEGKWKVSIFLHDRDTHYPLLDRHRLVKCENCHRTPLFGAKTPARCVDCHRIIDNEKGHRGSLGDKCDKCHNAKGWKGTSFDHDRDTKFPLRDKHVKAKCAACHKDVGMREKLPLKCAACHERDDREKGHKGSYGEKCETCHNANSFKPSIFDHGRDARFALTGKHLKTKCVDCHHGPLYVTKTKNDCYACHKKDDMHFATYGLDCERCHVSDDWRKIVRKDGDKGAQPPAAPASPPQTVPAP